MKKCQLTKDAVDWMMYQLYEKMDAHVLDMIGVNVGNKMRKAVDDFLKKNKEFVGACAAYDTKNVDRLTDEYVKLGLDCLAHGFGLPQIEFKKNGK